MAQLGPHIARRKEYFGNFTWDAEPCSREHYSGCYFIDGGLGVGAGAGGSYCWE
jgi:hypothetical protein